MIWIVAGYAAFAAFNFWSLWQHDKAKYSRITRGDVCFYLFVAACGPIGLGASLSALSGHKAKKWANTAVWEKRD